MCPENAAPEHLAGVGRGDNLPVPLTPFIGREQTVAAVGRLLATTRLLSLTGPPGVGKSRLALEVAAARLDAHADEAWLVELAPLTSPDLVPQAIAATLGIRERSGHLLVATIVEAVRARPLLLVLDNCEHLLEACAAIADSLLRSCPRLRLGP